MFKSLIDDDMPFASELRPLTPPGGALQAWQAKDTPETRGAMLRELQPTIDKAIFTHIGSNPSPTIRTRAKLMAIDAMRRFDPSRGTPQTHLLSQLQGLRRLAAKSQQIIGIPERVILDRQHLQETAKQLEDELGRSPSDAELAGRTGLSLKRLQYIRGAVAGVNSGSLLDAEGEVFAPASQVPGSTSKADAWADLVYYDLSDIDRKVMEHTLGRGGHPVLSTNQLADMLNVSPGAISQRKAKIQQLLDQQYEIDPFGGPDA